MAWCDVSSQAMKHLPQPMHLSWSIWAMTWKFMSRYFQSIVLAAALRENAAMFS